MKKVFVLATAVMLLSGAVAFANNGDKNKNKGSKAKTEKTCTKQCPKPCPKPVPPCCDKSSCDKG